MRGDDIRQDPLFSYVSTEERIPADHPLRKLRAVVNGILDAMGAEFAPLYSAVGRPSIPPEQLLRALLVQVLFTVRSERQLMEQMRYNLLFRWFVGLTMDEAVWDASTFSANRERLLNQDIARVFFGRVLDLAQWQGLTSDEHFSVDGTLIQAWASHKSFKPKDGGEPPSSGGRNAEVDFKGEKRSNATHASTTDPDARLYRKSDAAPALLGYLAHGLMENRSGLIVDVETTPASGTAERDAAITMLQRSVRKQGATLGGDKGYDTQGLRRALARQRRNTACRPEHDQPAQRDRWPHHASCRLRGQPAQAQADRGSVWLDQDRRRNAQDPLHRAGARRRPIPVHVRRLQPGAYRQPARLAPCRRRRRIATPAASEIAVSTRKRADSPQRKVRKAQTPAAKPHVPFVRGVSCGFSRLFQHPASSEIGPGKLNSRNRDGGN